MNANNVAAFFDIDGTLLAAPSLELRFVAHLVKQRELRPAAVCRWFAKFLAASIGAICRPHHIPLRLRAIDRNRLYLAGVSALEDFARSVVTNLDATEFLPEALAQLAWHRIRGHKIVFVSGTLAPLACALVRRIVPDAELPIVATEPEISGEFFTGRIAGEAIAGPAKARTIKRLAAHHAIDLLRSYAYGNSSLDRWMLAAVGHAVAVNPSSDLAFVARRNGWRIAQWRPAIDVAPTFAGDPFVLSGRPSWK
jgi:HAD superfamily hydrolase (TIGR01490 family)